MQSELNILNYWCRKNLLEINAGKTKVMIMGMKKTDASQYSKYCNMNKLKIGHVEIDFTDDYKYLGVDIDMNLSFNKYVRNIIGKVSYKLNQLCSMRKYITKQTATMLYKSMILSVIDYGSMVLLVFLTSNDCRHYKTKLYA